MDSDNASYEDVELRSSFGETFNINFMKTHVMSGKKLPMQQMKINVKESFTTNVTVSWYLSLCLPCYWVLLVRV